MDNELGDNRFRWLVESNVTTLCDEDHHLGKLLENEGAYSDKRLTTNCNVQGRLNKEPRFAEFYHDVLKAEKSILEVVMALYVIPFSQLPPKCTDK